jgi:hypothetical protein
MKLASVALLWVLGPLVLLTALSGCRGCEGAPAHEAQEASGPTMPTGLLTPPAPLPVPATDSPQKDAAAGLSLGTVKTDGAVELQVAQSNDAPDRTSFERGLRGSRFLSLDAMPLFHDAFAKAAPGFDLFLPRLLDGTALGRLRAELRDLRGRVASTSNLAAAKAQWAAVAPLISGLADDSEWLSARAELLGTIDSIVAFAAGVADQGKGLWILGP